MATSQDLLNADLNLATLDGIATSSNETVPNRLGRQNLTFKGFENRANAKIDALGFVRIEGATFETGATVPDNRSLLLWATADGGTGFYYYFSGEISSGGKIVPENSTPASTGGTGDGGWLVINDLEQRLAESNSTALIAGITAAQVAAAANISLNNFVTPEQFFTGDEEDPNADYYSAITAAIATGKMVLLSKEYGVSRRVIFPENCFISGNSRVTCGIFLIGTPVTGGNSAALIAGSNVTLRCFKISANDAGSAPSNRFNSLAIDAGSYDFNISQVDVYDATGYGHVTFGTESEPDITGVYYDCKSINCQVCWEQIGALDVKIYSPYALGTARTLSLFHPYAGSKRVTYRDALGEGTGAGIDINSIGGNAVGPIIFDGLTLKLTGTTSGVFTQGDDDIDLTITNGNIDADMGQSYSLNTTGKVKVIGGSAKGAEGFNCPADSSAVVELQNVDISARKDSATAPAYGLITNGVKPKISGGSIKAENSLAGGAQAVLGEAVFIGGTDLTPAGGSSFSPRFESGGTSNIIAETTNLGYFNISLVANTTIDKLSFTYSLFGSADDYVTGSFTLQAFLVAPDTVRVKFRSDNPVAGYKLSYRYAILP